jgi:hypothetical protein
VQQALQLLQSTLEAENGYAIAKEVRPRLLAQVEGWGVGSGGWEVGVGGVGERGVSGGDGSTGT